MPSNHNIERNEDFAISTRKPTGYKSPAIRQLYIRRALDVARQYQMFRRRHGILSENDIV